MVRSTDRPACFLALGDSYTIGECVGAAERWPQLVVERLRAEGAEIADPVVIATTVVGALVLVWCVAELAFPH